MRLIKLFIIIGVTILLSISLISAETEPPPDKDKYIPVEQYPEMIYMEQPDYPQLALQAGITGVVWVKALVDKDGKVRNALVHKSSGNASLDQAAVNAAYKNKFKPGIQGGKAVNVWVSYKVEFSLDVYSKKKKVKSSTKNPSVVAPKLVKLFEPIYPEEAKQDKFETSVFVEALIDKNGKPVKVKIEKCFVKNVGFEEAAIEAVYKSEFKPAIRRGNPVKKWITIQIDFKFDEETKRLPHLNETVIFDVYPEMILRVNPEYPAEAKRRNVTGIVSVKVLVDKEGNVLKAIIDESCGVPILDEAAKEAAFENKFKPGTYIGQPVACWTEYNVSFTFDSQADQETPIASVNTITRHDRDTDGYPGLDEFVPIEVYPKMIKQTIPDYPKEAKRRGITGDVFVKVLIDKNGDVRKALVAKSSGAASIDQAAVEAAYYNKFKPGIQDGKPVNVWVSYKVSFRLND